MDIESIRRDVPACQQQLFVNSAGSSLPALNVNQTIQRYLHEEAEIGGYAYMAQQQSEIADFYVQAAQLLHTKPRNIAFASSATDAYAKAISSIAFKTGDVILTSDDDYVSNYIQFINLQQQYGVRIERMSLLDNGDLDLAAIASQMDRLDPKLVSLSHVPTNSGLVQDAAAIGSLCKERDIIYILDACQSVGQWDVDVSDMQCDFLNVTGRKFLRGPRGTGILYVSDRILDKGMCPIAMDAADTTWLSAQEYRLGDTAKRFEYWEKSYALLQGLTAALRYANDLCMQAIGERNRGLSTAMRSTLSDIPGVLMQDRGTKTCNIITLRKDGVEQSRMAEVLHAAQVRYGISVHAHAVIDYDKKGIDWVLRLSPHYFNTLEELERLGELVEEM